MNENRYGILIASSRFPNEKKLEDLRCPENDVDGLKELLASKTYGQFSEPLIVSKNEFHHEVQFKLQKLLNSAEKDALVLIYYSGHGKLNSLGNLCLATTNTDVSALDATSIPVQTLKNYIDMGNSQKVVMILDCCYSGAIGGVFHRSGVDDQLNLISSGGKGIYIMTASTEIQAAVEKESDIYGIFTKYIIEGIKSGKADKYGKGEITVNELYEYAHDRVVAEGFQKPMRWDIRVCGSPIVISLSGQIARKERAKQIRKILTYFIDNGHLPNQIWTTANEVIVTNPSKMKTAYHHYDALLEKLLQEGVDFGEFVHQWYDICYNIEKKEKHKTLIVEVERETRSDENDIFEKKTDANSKDSYKRTVHNKAITLIDKNVSIEWCRIPAGRFSRGCPEEFMQYIERKYKTNTDIFRTYSEREESLEEFWMSMIPITNVQFYSFVKKIGHRYPGSWRGISPPYRRNDANKPVTRVTWQDCADFAFWLQSRLPSRAEYEKSCRGQNGLLFPWGNKFDKTKCNTDESGIGHVTAVDAFTTGVSVYGILDLIGNVWEWVADDEGEYRMTVGASFESTGEIYGVGFFDVKRLPNSSEDNLGFRIACSDIRDLNVLSLKFENDAYTR